MRILPRLEKSAERFREIESELSQPEAVKDQARYQKLMKELAQLRPLTEAFALYQKDDQELRGLRESLAESSLDGELKKLYQEEIQDLEIRQNQRIHELESFFLRGSDPNAARDVIVEVRAGTGGEEAALFVADLFRMYSKYATAHNLAVEVMDSTPTGKGGFKEIIFGISGPHAFRHFKFESGIHRVQRVPETEASGRIHTSAVTVAVLPEAEEVDIQINPADLRIETFRSSGPGGQHVNKTDSAVRMIHIPTGLVVSCQDEKSQHKNKTKALRILRSRLLEKKRREQDEEIQQTRRQQVGSGDRSGKIRTYNFPDRRITDHRIALTLHNLDDILNGHLEDLIEALEREERARRLTGENDHGN